MREWCANDQRDCKYTGNSADELRNDVEDRVPILHFSKTPERESDRGIKMRTGAFSKRRENKSNRSAAHCDSRQRASCEFAGDEIQNWRVRMMKENWEQPGKDQ